MSLFTLGEFKLHSGQASRWKIDCDYLGIGDWQALALMASEILPPFGSVEGVPTGGNDFAEALWPYASNGPLLIADDVCTTGKSLEEHRAGRNAIGVVVFVRGVSPYWVYPLFVAGGKR